MFDYADCRPYDGLGIRRDDVQQLGLQWKDRRNGPCALRCDDVAGVGHLLQGHCEMQVLVVELVEVLSLLQPSLDGALDRVVVKRSVFPKST